MDPGHTRCKHNDDVSSGASRYSDLFGILVQEGEGSEIGAGNNGIIKVSVSGQSQEAHTKLPRVSQEPQGGS